MSLILNTTADRSVSRRNRGSCFDVARPEADTESVVALETSAWRCDVIILPFAGYKACSGIEYWLKWAWMNCRDIT